MLVCVQHLYILQFAIEILVHTVQDSFNLEIILQLDSDDLRFQRLKEREEEHCVAFDVEKQIVTR